MRVITLNVNGIRAAARKGMLDWLKTTQADVVCIQELKAHLDQLQDPIFWPEGYHCYYMPAERKGYSGVAIFSKIKPNKIHQGLGWEVADTEGRYIQADFDNLSVASAYLPSGSSSEERQQIKMDFLELYLPHLKSLKRKRRGYIIAGDFNIAHKEIDLKNWRANRKNSGFLPDERQWLDKVFDDLGYVDAFRAINPHPDQYTWWSNRGQAWANNVGWRIDYQVISPSLEDKVHAASIYKEQRFSDHAPLIMDYDQTL